MKNFIRLLMLFMIITSCSTSRIVTTWITPEKIQSEYNTILVLGLIRDVDRSIQQSMENHFVNDLQKNGYKAISSLKEYGPKAFEKMTEDEVLQKLDDKKINAVVTIVLLDKEKERDYIPGHMRNTPFYYYYSYFGGYWGVMYRRIYEPGYYTLNTKYFWETNLYEFPSKKLIYSAQTQSFDPESSENLGHEYSLLIVNDMIKQNILRVNNRVDQAISKN